MNENNIVEELKKALKSGDKIKVSVLRMLISDLKNKKINDRIKELSEDQVLGIMRKRMKMHKESIGLFKEAGREDLVGKEEQEAGVLQEYMPEEMSEKETKRIVSAVIEEIDAKTMKDMGRVMKEVQERSSGRADGKIVSRIVKDILT